jgi:hypothetical protein
MGTKNIGDVASVPRFPGSRNIESFGPRHLDGECYHFCAFNRGSP